MAELFLSTLLCGALFGVFLTKLVALLCVGLPWAHWPVGLFFLAFVMALLSAAVALLAALWSDIRWGLIDNRYGLCKGNTVARPGDPAWLTGLSEWLHDGIQLSAGLKRSDPPLTFRDLWQAPSHPGAAPRPCKSSDPPERRTINLQMLTTNVTHGRPYRLPLTDRSSRLFFRRSEWEGYFPTGVLNALESHAIPYAPRDGSGSEPAADHPSARDLLELPVEDLPVVVAARLSLSFPLLFSAVPLWAIDFEALPKHRTMKCCLFTDGGVSSNFPIHLFDAAVPRWPTFGFWLDRHPPYKYKAGEDDVWLPKTNGQGRGDNWDRFDPASKAFAEPSLNGVDGLLAKPTTSASDWTAQLSAFFGYLLGIGVSTKDWRDRSNMRMTHVRNRVVRLMLRSDEGNLNIGMPGKQLLDMAHRYGTQAGKAFVDRFGDKDGQPSQAWSEQRWVRMNVLLNGLRELLTGMSAAVGWSLRTVPLDQAISAAARNGPVRNARTDPGRDHLIAGEQVPDLKQLLADIQRLEMALRATRPAFESSPNPELRLRPPF